MFKSLSTPNLRGERTPGERERARQEAFDAVEPAISRGLPAPPPRRKSSPGGLLVVDVTEPIDVSVATPPRPTTPVVLPEKEPVSPVGVEHAPDLYRRKTRKGRSESPARSWEANNGLEDNIAGGASWLPPQPLPTKDPTPLPRRGRASTPGGRWRRTKSPTGGATLQPPSDLAVRDARPGPAIRSYSCRTSTGDDVSCDRAFALLCVTLDGAGAEGAA